MGSRGGGGVEWRGYPEGTLRFILERDVPLENV